MKKRKGRPITGAIMEGGKELLKERACGLGERTI